MSAPIVFNPTLTSAGQAAAFNASNDGLDLKITHVSFGTAHYDPTGAEEHLIDQVSDLIPIAGGSRPSLTQIRMTSIWRADAGTFPIGEVGFWSDDVLVFVWSKADGSVAGYKTPGVDFVLFNDLSFSQVPPGSINILVDPDASIALAALAAHEGADNAHPQYVRRDIFPAEQVGVWAKAVSGTANALVITLQDGVHVEEYVAGLAIRFKAAAQNTGAVTVNIDGHGVADVRKSGGDALVASDIKVGAVYELVYDGTNFQLAGGVGGSGLLKKFPYLATAGQTSFPASYTPGSLLVFQNGRELGELAYTATDGVSVVLSKPAMLNDEVLIVTFSVFAVADAFTKGESDAKFAPLISPLFSGNPRVPTAPKFDADSSAVSSEFVQRALGNYADFQSTQIAVSRTMLAEEAGGVFWLGNSGGGDFTVTLPSITSVPKGASFSFIATGNSSNYMVVGSGTDLTIAYSGAGVTAGFTINQVLLRGGETVEMVSNGAYWFVRLGQFQHMDIFKASLNTTGYQRLPSGQIRHFGTVTVPANTPNHPVSLATPYAKQLLKVLLSPSLPAVGNLYMLGWTNKTLGGFGITNPNASAVVVDWETIGF